MEQFVVPQFIDVEDKIFGPITTRQFIILLIGGGIVFLAYRFGDLALFAVMLAVVGGISFLFAFGKINGQLFHYFLLNIIQTLRKPGLRVWQKYALPEELEHWRKLEVTAPAVAPPRKEVERRHIRDLALVVNTGGYYHGEE